MPYARWVLDTVAAYNRPVPHLDADCSVDWAEVFDDAFPLTWDDLDQLLAAAVACEIAWALPLQVWPNAKDPRHALITYDLPDGNRRASLSEDVDFYQPPTEHPTLADAVVWGLQAIRESGEQLVRIDVALRRALQEATTTVFDWDHEHEDILAQGGLAPDEQVEDASDLDDAIRPYERDALAQLRALAALAAGRCPVCNLTDCDAVGEQRIARCRCGRLHCDHNDNPGCASFRTA
jgi:hypothetical protein